MLEKEEAPEAISFIVNSLGILPNMSFIHGAGDALYGLLYSTIMTTDVLGITKQNRTKNCIDYKRMYITAALMPLSDKIANGFVQKDPETGEYITNPSFHLIDFTKEYPGVRLDLGYKGLKMLGKYLPFKTIFWKCPLVGDILYGISLAGQQYHDKMTNGDDFIESVAFSVMQGVSYPIVKHYLHNLPFFNNDSPSFGSFLKGVWKALPFWKNRDPKSFIEILKELRALIPTFAMQKGSSFATNKLDSIINDLIAKAMSPEQISDEELEACYQMIESELQNTQ